VRSFLRKGGGKTIAHEKIYWRNNSSFRRDGIHLTEKRSDISMTNFKDFLHPLWWMKTVNMDFNYCVWLCTVHIVYMYKFLSDRIIVHIVTWVGYSGLCHALGTNENGVECSSFKFWFG
jgi:hypothetical protein